MTEGMCSWEILQGMGNGIKLSMGVCLDSFVFREPNNLGMTPDRKHVQQKQRVSVSIGSCVTGSWSFKQPLNHCQCQPGWGAPYCQRESWDKGNCLRGNNPLAPALERALARAQFVNTRQQEKPRSSVPSICPSTLTTQGSRCSTVSPLDLYKVQIWKMCGC